MKILYYCCLSCLLCACDPMIFVDFENRTETDARVVCYKDTLKYKDFIVPSKLSNKPKDRITGPDNIVSLIGVRGFRWTEDMMKSKLGDITRLEIQTPNDTIILQDKDSLYQFFKEHLTKPKYRIHINIK